ncbi:MAG: class I SAM-dependent methyltransferase [Thermoplasmatota archaeon]
MVRVERTRAEGAIRELLRQGVLDRGRRIRRTGALVDIPVLAPPSTRLGEILEEEGEPVEERMTPIQRIRRSASIPDHLRSLLPAKWERYGRVLVIRLPSGLMEHRAEVARAYARALGVETVLIDKGGSAGELRLPSVEVVLGESTETVHIEDGVRYAFDPARLMFSSGNIAERMRMGGVVRAGEVVVDMFAGIGYFSLPMAVHGRAGRVLACELNPEAYRYLWRNVALNRVGGVVEPILGDCRLVAPEGSADRVVMGHFDAIEYASKAVRVLRPEGGVLHLHALCPKTDIPNAVWRPLKTIIQKESRRAELLGVVRLKSFKPKVWHIVLDVAVS